MSGWSRALRVGVLRKKLTGELLITGKDEGQGEFAFIRSCVREIYARFSESAGPVATDTPG